MKPLSLCVLFLALANCSSVRLGQLPTFDHPLCTDRVRDREDKQECLRRLTAFAGRALQSTVTLRVRGPAKDSVESVGSGVIIDAVGRVFTAYHVVRDKMVITAVGRYVGGADGRLAFAELVGVPMRVVAYAERLDLALLAPLQRGGLPGPIATERIVRSFAQDEELWFFSPEFADNQGRVVTGLSETVILPDGEERVELIRIEVPSAVSDLGGPVLAPNGTVVGLMLVADESGRASYFAPISGAVQLFGLTSITEVVP